VKKDGHSNPPKKNRSLSITRRTFLQGTALAGAGALAGQGIFSSRSTALSPGKVQEKIQEKSIPTSCLN